MKWEINLERLTQRRSSPDKVLSQIHKIAHIIQRNQTTGFKAITPRKIDDPEVVQTNEGIRYRQKSKIIVEKDRVRSEEATNRYFQAIVERARARAALSGWTLDVRDENGAPTPLFSSAKQNETIPLADYSLDDFKTPELNEVSYNQFFSEVYDREPHIRVIHDAFSDFLTNNTSRNHILLYGEPSSCKTTLMERFKDFYEFNYNTCEVIFFLDKTTMSKAGLENTIIDKIDSGTLPKILAIEEIEKGALENINCLISIMGSGRMTKNNAKIGNYNKECPVVIIASCNDIDQLASFQRGALLSRFSHKIYNAIPDMDLMERILMDRVIKIGGNPLWVDKCIDLAYNVWKREFGEFYDKGNPRGVKSLLSGRTRLMDNSFQNDLIAIEKKKPRVK